MLSRLFLLLMLIFSTTVQARHHGPVAGYASAGCPGAAVRDQETGRGYPGCAGEHRRGGGGYRGGRNCGGHSRWDIPVQEARRLNPIEVSPQSLERGATLFRENCARCHGDYGFGDGPQAKGLRVMPPSLHHAARHYSDGELFYIIRKGRDPMPAWQDILSEQALWNLINHLRFQIGAHHGPRFSYWSYPYRTTEAVPESQAEQTEAMSEAPQHHQAMGHDDMHSEDNRSKPDAIQADCRDE